MEQEKKQKASAGKEPPKGKVLSSDYREMFENADGEVSVAEPETPPTKSSETVSKQESPVQAAVKAAQEGLDLLQEETEETPEKRAGRPCFPGKGNPSPSGADYRCNCAAAGVDRRGLSGHGNRTADLYHCNG